MPRYSRIRILGFIVSGLMIGASADAQMPITRGKGDRGPEVDPGILREQAVEKKAAQVPFPPARVIIGGANGQKHLTLEQPAPAPAEEDRDGFDGPPEEPPIPQRRMPLDLRTAVLGRDNFDRWVFGDGFSGEARREHLNSKLRNRLVSARRRLGLTPAQESKLGLAAQGDIKRFFDRVEEKRREFEAARMNFNDGRRFLSSIGPLGLEFEEGPFGVDSLFAKTLRKIESDALGAGSPGN